MSTITTKCPLCEQLVDLDETRASICIDCLWKGFRLISYFEAIDPTKNVYSQNGNEPCATCGTLTMFTRGPLEEPACVDCMLGKKKKKKKVVKRKK